MAAPLEVAQATRRLARAQARFFITRVRPSIESPEPSKHRQPKIAACIFWTTSLARHRSELFNVNRHYLTFNVMIVVVESLAKQIPVANCAPYSVRGKRRVASMTANISGSSVAEIKLNMIELKLDRLIEEMRFLKSHTIAFHTRMREIEAYLKTSEPSEQQPESKLTPWLTAAASATARTALFAVGAAIGAALTKVYLGT
jgi:hypothetical protein